MSGVLGSHRAERKHLSASREQRERGCKRDAIFSVTDCCQETQPGSVASSGGVFLFFLNNNEMSHISKEMTGYREVARWGRGCCLRGYSAVRGRNHPLRREDAYSAPLRRLG